MIRLVSIFLLCSMQSFAGTACRNTKDSFKCVKYLRNHDGDTFTVSIPKVHPLLGEDIGIRVRGVDTPEMVSQSKCEKDAAKKAQKSAHDLLSKAKRIDLIHVGRDKYFRILADVVVDGNPLKDYLIKEKLAVPYDGGTKAKTNWCPN